MSLTTSDAPKPLLNIENATVVKGNQRVLDSLSLTIAEGEHTAILGPNGSGKSSLIKLITHYHYPLARVDGLPVVTMFGRDNWNVFTLRSMLGIVSADLHVAFTSGLGSGRLIGLDAVISGFFASHGLFDYQEVSTEMRDAAWEAMTLVHADHLAARPLETLSTGEARRILIARALVTRPRALLLDEPTTGLDLVARQLFLEMLRELARTRATVILVTHHVEEILPEISRVVLLKDGRIAADGAKEALLTDAILSDVFGGPVHVAQSQGYYFAVSTPTPDIR